MSYDNIINLLKEYLQVGIIIIAFLALIIFIGYYMVYKKLMKGKSQISFRKLGILAVFLCYLIVVIGATLGRTGSYQGNASIYPFSAYKEAWNNVSKVLWRNIILNILMFIPIGFLLPILSSRFKKAWRTFLFGFLFTFGIELIQHYTSRGVFEIDDIIGNTIGTMIGYGLNILLFYVVEKLRNRNSSITGRKVLVFQIPLIITIVLFSSIYLVYSKQELGNLSFDYIYKYNMSDIHLESHIPLSDLEEKAYVYKANIATKDETLKLANDILKKFNTEVDKKENKYFDDTASYKSVSGDHSVWIDYKGATVWFIDYSQREVELYEGYNEEQVKSILEDYNITLPKGITFENEGEGRYIFTADMNDSNEGFINGIISCMITKGGKLLDYNNNLIQCEKYKEYDIISEQEAFDKLKEGKVNHIFLYEEPKSIDVQGVELDYILDSKGYYQPTYLFRVIFDGDMDEERLISIKALKK